MSLKRTKGRFKKEMSGKKPKWRRLEWNEGSEEALLDLWPERLEELRSQRKNGRIYSEMAVDLSKLGYTYSPRNVQVKLQNFTQRYRKEKAALDACSILNSSWPYYERVHKIIGGFKTNLSSKLAYESSNGFSIASSLLSSLTTSMPASSSPLPATPSPSPVPSSLKDKNISNFQITVLQKLDNLSSVISEHFKKSKENEKQLIEIERRKANSLEKIEKNSEELKNAFILFLNKN